MEKIMQAFHGARRFERFLIAAAILTLVLARSRPSPAADLHQTPQEARLSAVLSCIDGAGRTQAVISEDGGVLILTDGAYDLRLYLQMEIAVQTLLGTEISRIEIIPAGD